MQRRIYHILRGEDVNNVNEVDEFMNGNFFVSKWEGRALTESPAWRFSSDIATEKMTKEVVFNGKCMQWEYEKT